MGAEHGALYGAVRARIGATLRSAGSSADGVNVPSCPEWTIAQLLSHLAGTTAALVAKDYPRGDTQGWVDRHVAERAGRSALENFAEWDAAGPAFEKMLEAREDAWGGLLYDAVIHEDDINGALGRLSPRDPDAVAYGLDRLFRTLDTDARAKSFGTLRVRAGSVEHVAGEGEPVDEWSVGDPWLALRALGSRRSVAQLTALGFDGPRLRWLGLLHSEPPRVDLVER